MEQCLYYNSKGDMEPREEFKNNREQYTLEIRRSNRQELFLKKRNNCRMDQQAHAKQHTSIIADQNYRDLLCQLEKQQFQSSQIDELCSRLEDADQELCHWAVVGLRKLLSEDEGEPLLQRIIDSGAVSKLIAMMRERKFPQLQLEATWIITNIAYGSSGQCEFIVSKNGVEALLQLLYENSGCILEQAMWGLGNIAGDCTFCRDTVIMKGGVECITRLVEQSSIPREVQLGCWVLSNLCRGETPPKYDLIKGALPVLASTVVKGTLTGQYLSGALWSLSLHSESSKSKIRLLLKVQNLVAKLIDICCSAEVDVVMPALRILGNISTGSQAQTNQLLNNHFLALLRRLLGHKKRSIRREACWTISNICAGPLEHVRKCMVYPDLVQRLMEMLALDEHDIKREICYILANMCNLGDPQQIYQLIMHFNALPSLALLLQQDDDAKTIQTALMCIYKLLGIGERISQQNLVRAELERIPGLLDRIQSLQWHTCPNIYKQLTKIIQRYFPVEESSF